MEQICQDEGDAVVPWQCLVSSDVRFPVSDKLSGQAAKMLAIIQRRASLEDDEA